MRVVHGHGTAQSPKTEDWGSAVRCRGEGLSQAHRDRRMRRVGPLSAVVSASDPPTAGRSYSSAVGEGDEPPASEI
jgi:hypothetical protein